MCTVHDKAVKEGRSVFRNLHKHLFDPLLCEETAAYSDQKLSLEPNLTWRSEIVSMYMFAGDSCQVKAILLVSWKLLQRLFYFLSCSLIG